MNPRRSRCLCDRAVALVELAIVLPVLALLAVGLIEFGFLWSSVGQVERAVQNGARTGAGQADARYADYELLRAVAAATASADGTTIERVVVYRSQTADGAVPSGCLSIPATGTSAKGVSGVCNVYSGAQARSDNPGGFGSTSPSLETCSPGAWDSAWCPTGRSRDPDAPMYLGLYLEVSYEGRTSLIPGSMTVERRAVYQIEPCKAGTSC